MCGIAGMIDLAGGKRKAPHGAVARMAQAIVHRGPDEDGYLDEPGFHLASRRLSIVGLADGRQPIGNEDGTVSTVFNGELYDYPEKRTALEAEGHTFRTHTDTELVPHLWEDHGEDMFERIRGQFAIALWDERQQSLVLARDRFGICPLFWVERDGWFIFASEIKALLASGLVASEPDVRGIDQLFCFMSVPGPATCFKGIRSLPPGGIIRVRPGQPIEERAYWEADFPDRGQ